MEMEQKKSSYGKTLRQIDQKMLMLELIAYFIIKRDHGGEIDSRVREVIYG